MNRFYYIYIITNIITDKSYIGFKMYDCESPNKVYMGSSKYLNIDIEKLGIENFKKVKLEENILFISKEETAKKESYYIHLYNTLNPNGYNKYDPLKNVFSIVGCHLSEKTKEKMKKSKKLMSKETKEKIKNSKIGIKIKRKKGIKHSEETKERMKLSQKKRRKIPVSEETKKKISESKKYYWKNKLKS